MKPTASVSILLVATYIAAIGHPPIAPAAEEKPEVKLLPDDKKSVAARVKSLTESAPKGATLVAYLNCGTQRQSAVGRDVKITWKSGEPYIFRSDAQGVPATQPTIFFGADRVEFELSGLDRSRRYMVGLTWWDYDAGGRAQQVAVGSPKGRLVRLAIPAIGLPNYTVAGQLPAERRFSLPVTFARDGRMNLIVQRVTGANAVISELWIWQLE